MVKILYGVQSDGMGHALRSRPVIEYLIKQGHSVKIVTSKKAKNYLSKYFEDIEDIHDISWFYFNNRVSYVITGIKFFLNIDKFFLKGALKIKRIFENYQPDIIITDFEFFTAKASKLYRRPLISLDNITVIKLFKVPKNIKNYYDYTLSKSIVDTFINFVDSYFVTSFFELPLRRKRYQKKLTVVPPILRDNIIKAKKKCKIKNHILVYQTTAPTKEFIDTLHECKDQNFIYYGHNIKRKSKNILFRKFSETDFIDDFANCKAVITNGGFSFISEAIYLHKPILSKPVTGQFEQCVNACMVDKNGYGKHISKFTKDNIYSFIGQLPLFYKNLEKYNQKDNEELFEKLNKEISKQIDKYSKIKKLRIVPVKDVKTEIKKSINLLLTFLKDFKNKMLKRNIDFNDKKIKEIENLMDKLRHRINKKSNGKLEVKEKTKNKEKFKSKKIRNKEELKSKKIKNREKLKSEQIRNKEELKSEQIRNKEKIINKEKINPVKKIIKKAKK